VPDQRFFDDRRRQKTDRELEGIRRATRGAEAGMATIASLLARSEPGDGGRVVDGEPLTCELLRHAATAVFAAEGCRGDDLSVAHGSQAADGHHTGAGRVANDDHLVCDLFPYDIESTCFSDMTRTFVVGTADPEIATWHEHTWEALELCRRMVRPGADGAEIYRGVCRFYDELGYPTSLSKPDGTVLREGFNHGLGHGVGLAVHEARGCKLATSRRRRRDHARARPLPARLRRRAARGSPSRHGGRLRDAHGLSVRARSARGRGTNGRMSDHAISTLLDEERRFPPDPAFAAQANARPEIYERDPDEFWESEGRDRVSWFEPFATLSEWELPYAKWYLGGTLNVAYNCVDRHVEAGLGERVAYHWEGEPGDTRTISYAELQRDVVRMANALKQPRRAEGHVARCDLHGGWSQSSPSLLARARGWGAPHTVILAASPPTALGP
jgi:hypothetical protein